MRAGKILEMIFFPIIIIGLLIWGYYPVYSVEGMDQHSEKRTSEPEQEIPEGELLFSVKKQEKSHVRTAIDPVCGAEVQKNTAFKEEYEGKSYYFCSKRCKEIFKKGPSKYQFE